MLTAEEARERSGVMKERIEKDLQEAWESHIKSDILTKIEKKIKEATLKGHIWIYFNFVDIINNKMCLYPNGYKTEILNELFRNGYKYDTVNHILSWE